MNTLLPYSEAAVAAGAVLEEKYGGGQYPLNRGGAPAENAEG